MRFYLMSWMSPVIFSMVILSCNQEAKDQGTTSGVLMSPTSSVPRASKRNVNYGEEVISPFDHYLCVTALQKKESIRGGKSPEQVCLENAQNICKANGFDTLVSYQKRFASRRLTETGYFIINQDPDFYEYRAVPMAPEKDFIPAQGTQPQQVTEIFSSVRCSDPSALPLPHRGAVFREVSEGDDEEQPQEGPSHARVHSAEREVESSAENAANAN